MTRKQDTRMVAALLREREGYRRRGETDRVAQVDEQLEHYGYEGDPKEATGPTGRAAPSKQTADDSKPHAAPASKPAAGRGANAKTEGDPAGK
ncbi:hypothetical protein ACFWBI_09100 [Streptomyces sp. NPDC059982]|uniref:hypothetical protein n=1 Tax=unclassified Streptomyces TaxID=2593676 RepID=UPI0036773050